MLRIALTVLDKELRESLRDPHVLLVTLGFPLLLYPLMAWGMAQLALVDQGRAEKEPPRVAVIGPPALVDAVATPPATEDQALPALQLEEAAQPEAARARVISGQLDALVQGQADGTAWTVNLAFHGAKARSRRARDRVVDRLDQWRTQREEEIAASAGVSAEALRGWPIRSENLSPEATVTRNLLSLALPGLMLLIIPIAAMYPAVEAVVAERERGTLETTLVTARNPGSVLLGKYLSVVALTTLAVVGNAVAMSLTLLHLRELLVDSGDLSIDLQLGPALAASAVVGCTVLMICAALVLAVVPARSFKQGETLASLVAMLAFVALPFAAMEQLRLTPAAALLPLANAILAVRDGVGGQIDMAGVALACAVDLAVTFGLLSAASHVVGGQRYLLGEMPRWLALLLRSPESP